MPLKKQRLSHNHHRTPIGFIKHLQFQTIFGKILKEENLEKFGENKIHTTSKKDREAKRFAAKSLMEAIQRTGGREKSERF